MLVMGCTCSLKDDIKNRDYYAQLEREQLERLLNQIITNLENEVNSV